jgi:hypothetical protein
MPARCPPVSTGKSETYPQLPANYFPADVAAATQTVPEMARRDRDAALFKGWPALNAPVEGAGGEVLFYSGRLAQLAGKGVRRRG